MMYIVAATWYIYTKEGAIMPEMTDIGCEECGAVFPMIVGATERKRDHVWFPGRTCPICGSEKFLPVPKTDGFEPKPIAKWKLDRRVGIAAGVVIFVFLIIGIVWHFHERPHREGGLKAVYMCDVCDKLFVKGVRGKVPKKCPKCKNQKAVQCLNCYTVYPLKAKDNPNEPPTCPKCKSKSARILVRLSDVQKKKPPKEKEEEEGEANEDEERVHPD